MIKSYQYRDFDVQIRASNFIEVGFTYSVLIAGIEHYPGVKPLPTWEEVKLDAREFAEKMIDKIY